MKLGEAPGSLVIELELPFGEAPGVERVHGFHDSGQ